MLVFLDASEKHPMGKGVHWDQGPWKEKIWFLNKLTEISLINWLIWSEGRLGNLFKCLFDELTGQFGASRWEESEEREGNEF